MRRNIRTYAVVIPMCLLILGILLFVAACSNPPGSGSPPQTTPTSTSGGYSLISLFDKELPFFLAPYKR